MADAADSDESRPSPSTPPAGEDDSNRQTLSPTLLQKACSLSPSPSPSTSYTSCSPDPVLRATDSGFVFEKSDTASSPENPLQTDDSGITLMEKGGQSDSEQACNVHESNTEQSNNVVDMVEVADAVEVDSDETPGLRRRYQRNQELSDSSSSSSSSGSGSSSSSSSRSSSSSDSHTSGPDETRTDDSESEEIGAQAAVEIPKDTFHPFREMMMREKGASSRCHSSFLLRERTGASINLVRRLTLHTKLNHHEGCVNSLHFNASGSLLASGSDDLNIILWDWAREKPYMVFDSGHRSNVFQSKFVPHCAGDSLMVTCARDGCVRLAELSSAGTCRGTKKLAQHRGAAHKLALMEDSPHVFYSCGEDAVVYQIDLRQNKPDKICVVKEKDRKIPLYSIHAHPARTHEFCVGGRDPYIRIYDTRMPRQEDNKLACVKKFNPHHLTTDGNTMKANVTCAVYNWNGTEVIGTYNDEDIYMFNTEHSDGANFVHRYKGHRNNATVKGVNYYGPKSEFIVSGSDCGNVFIWEKESEKIVTYFSADEGGVVNVLEPHPHNPYLATSGLDHDVKIFLPTSEHPTNLDGLKRVKRKNAREREVERTTEPDMIDGHMMWVLLQHLRRSARSEARQGGEELTPSTSSDDDDDEQEEYDDDDGEAGPSQCVPS